MKLKAGFFISWVGLLALSAISCRTGGGEATGQAPALEKPSPVIESRQERTCVDLNRASVQELMQLPAIGEVTARKIVEYRERHGRFHRAEEIIIIEGFSERKFKAIADLVCAR